MAAAPPSAVLSESFQEHLEGRRVTTAVFFTFSFDPAFFEQQILPVFLDVPLSQATAVRLVQLEDEIRHRLDHVAVYYDPRGLMTSSETPKLDVRRVPVPMQGGFFHPKNVFLLTESENPEDGEESHTLIVATLSANLTEAGWWRNVECAHVETVEAGSTFGFRDDLLRLFQSVREATPANSPHDALEKVRRFVVACGQRTRVSDGQMPARLFAGRSSFVKFISEETKGRLHGLNLEVIAPYVDDSEALPLKALIKEFAPRECRVFLPRASNGNVACSEDYYKCVKEIPETYWGHLPKSILQLGKAENASERFVHAKVYRFFHPTRRYEAIVVGSVNLTGAAHNRGGNLESAFVVEPDLNQVPEWWLSRADGKKSLVFSGADPVDDVTSLSPAVWLSLTYDWGTGKSQALWQHKAPSPQMDLSFAGIRRLTLAPMSQGELRNLNAEDAVSVRTGLETTALCAVAIAGHDDGPLLVREEGMAWKPSILLTLTVADILRYWSALTREQRHALLENIALRDPALAGMLTQGKRSALVERDSFFDNFAQIFQAFENVGQAVKKAFEDGRESEAVQRLLGEKYDSLPCLLNRVFQAEEQTDALSRYLIALCARQTITQARKANPEFGNTHRARFDELIAKTDTTALRGQLDLSTVEKPEMFLDWFEKWFVARAEPAKEQA